MPTIEELRDLNTRAITRLRIVEADLNERLEDPETSLDDFARLISRRSTLQAQLNVQQMISAHLKAAAVVVEFTKTEETKLEKLDEKMDELILQGLALNAFLAMVPKVVDAAASIGNLINGHTARAA
jgi:vacuolar-type H+-ATPase subunit I/STV1